MTETKQKETKTLLNELKNVLYCLGYIAGLIAWLAAVALYIIIGLSM
jgi:hypothetical protein